MSNDTAQADRVRLLPLEGLYNVRDLGGYPAGGGQVKWGLLYRAGDLHDPRPQAKTYLENRRIRTIVDFRDDRERAEAPDGEFSTVEKIHVLSIYAGSVLDLRAITTGAAGEELMRRLYVSLAAECRSQYRRFFSILSDPENSPVLFHCSAGKDRTGLGAALLLSALGVDRETIVRDYLLSGEYVREKYRDWLAQSPHLEPLMTVRPGYIEAAFEYIETTFGSVEGYLRKELGADPDRLRSLYTGS
ncbi:MAG: tyrosine-protein phosphatase [Spirochaetaceae bacterium]|jgi:protein-tyrosine phosphatase|nr:tyrosine-protein phosphatase [Spirochaetaceae bacterium]